MGARFEWNSNELKHQMQELGNKALQEKGRQLQQLLDRLSKELAGKDLDTATERIKEAWTTELGGEIDQDAVRKYAEVLIQGRTIEVRPEMR